MPACSNAAPRALADHRKSQKSKGWPLAAGLQVRTGTGLLMIQPDGDTDVKMSCFTYFWNADRDCETTPANATHIMVLYENRMASIASQPSRSWRMFAL